MVCTVGYGGIYCSISHLLLDVHLYKFFTCLDINKICLKDILLGCWRP